MHPNTLGASNRGGQNQSIVPSVATSATVCMSPITPWFSIGAYDIVRMLVTDSRQVARSLDWPWSRARAGAGKAPAPERTTARPRGAPSATGGVSRVWLGGGGRGVRLEVQLAHEPVLRLRAHRLLDDRAVLEQDDGRDRQHAEATGEAGLGIHVELRDLDPAGEVLRDLVDDGTDHPARAAPLGPEVDEHGQVGLDDLA